MAIVTGASSGIGLEVTKRLATKGYRVVANSRNITSAMTLQATGDLKLVDGDIGLPETAQRVVAAAMRDFGRIDLLVNNAGSSYPSRLLSTCPKIFEGRRKRISPVSFMYLNWRWRKCVSRNSGTSSTSPRRW